jgi:hypothetical protein
MTGREAREGFQSEKRPTSKHLFFQTGAGSFAKPFRCWFWGGLLLKTFQPGFSPARSVATYTSTLSFSHREIYDNNGYSEKRICAWTKFLVIGA